MKPIRISRGKVLNDIENHKSNIWKCKANAEEVRLIDRIQQEYWTLRARIEEDLLDQKIKLLDKIDRA